MGEAYDFYNPFMSAVVTTVDGLRFPLWSLGKDTDRSLVRLGETAALAFLQEVSVEMQLAYLPIIKAVLTPPYRDGINFLDSRLIEWGQSTLSVQMGYVNTSGGVTSGPLYEGILLKPEVQLGQDISITLNAQGVGGFAAVRQQGNLTLNDVTRKEVVTRLFERFKIRVDDKEVEKVSASQTTTAADWKKTKLPTYTQGGDTHWTAAAKVIREAGLYSYLTTDEQGPVMKILPASYVFSSKPTRVFRAYDFASGQLFTAANPVFPILSASSPTMAIYLPASTRGYFIQDVRSNDRKEVKKLVGESQVAPPRTGVGNASQSTDSNPDVDPDTGAGAEIYPGNPSDEQLVSEVKAEYTAQTTAMGIQLTLESLGDPTILPGMVIAVRGLGARIDGNFAILKVTHTMGSGGYTMSMECVSNVDKALSNAKKAFGPTAPEPEEDGFKTGGHSHRLTEIVTIDPVEI